MLVVVNVVPGVAVVAMDVVEVVLVRHRDMPAAFVVDVHVAGVREVAPREVDDGVDVVDVVLVDMVDVPVVEEVDVILVRDRDMPAEPVVDVRVRLERVMRRGVGHRNLRRSR
jgi:hypothetical protein